MAKPQVWGQKSFVLITGASQGIGRGLAIEFSKKVSPGSVLLLIARNEEKLEETKSLVSQASPEVEVQLALLDLSKLSTDKYTAAVNSAISSKIGREASSFDNAILVHNAGHIGDVDKKLSEHFDEAYLEGYYNLNLLSVLLLNSVFLKSFPDSSKLRVVLQISSVTSKLAVPYMGTYCVGKAARNHFIKTMVAEEENVTALSYAPGLVETDMFTACENSQDPKLGGLFQSMRELGNLGRTEEMYQHLIQLLESREFENGGFVDFFAQPEEYHPVFKGIQL